VREEHSTNRPPDTLLHCPYCGSQQVKSNANAVTAGSYWRCDTCGEVWNPTRLWLPSRSRFRA
jgi:transposase-like protein